MSNARTSLHRRSSKRLARRYAADRRFKLLGLGAVVFACLALFILLSTIVMSGWSGFFKTEIQLAVPLDLELLGVDEGADAAALEEADYHTTLRRALYAHFPEVSTSKEKRRLATLLSALAETELKRAVLADPSQIGRTIQQTFTASSAIDQLHKGYIDPELPAGRRPIDDDQIAWYRHLVEQDRVSISLNDYFFTRADSRSPELAGVAGAVLGSMYTLVVCLLISFPLGVAAAVYLEEFAPKNRWTEIVEVNINNLAAVPSIIYGLLGLAILLNVFGLPRGTPLVGGAVLSLMTFPTIIIACRASLKAVPDSIRQGALAIGASPVQMVLHHVLPLALPGTLTGAILGLSRALGETAPLLMIGMVAFIVNVPSGPAEPSAVLPVQIFLWAESPERGFTEKTSAAIIVILVFLLCMNGAAVWMRNHFERRW